ncbi:MAG: type IV toxin-antitoxin system AbiEi family antitoxin domain-containing protein [Nocardioides sp.]|nr:type IV toxin-antitoxin system AbiEi family antitoxin domain-containing protein [Nocardioides sp.]
MDLVSLARHQDGVLSRRQVLALGLNDDDIARMLRRREWARLFPGVYVGHTGPPSWRQRAWGATLLHSPAALGSWSALQASGIRVPESHEISLVITAHRRVEDPPGVHTVRTRAWDRVAQLHLSPPRVRLEIAALSSASGATTADAAVALLGDLVQQRRTTAGRLREALNELTRLPRRRLLDDVLSDVAAGAVSALERRYLRDVERAHGLPRGSRQRRASVDGTTQLRDVSYDGQGVAVELDGRLGHELWRDRWADLDRDLRTLRDGSVTVRAGWGQVLQPCRLADMVSDVLVSRGWCDRPHSCGTDCGLT